MFDWIKRLYYGELQKDVIKSWATKKIEEEKAHAEFIEKCRTTPSFSRCVIANKSYNSIGEKSQKQKQQLKSYKQALENSVDL
mgnify:CR=1 FL=1|tara:strand:- start:254 stop:502 length:249 start_codon:yes stop_codon:yes gene_type:complete